MLGKRCPRSRPRAQTKTLYQARKGFKRCAGPVHTWSGRTPKRIMMGSVILLRGLSKVRPMAGRRYKQLTLSSMLL